MRNIIYTAILILATNSICAQITVLDSKLPVVIKSTPFSQKAELEKLLTDKLKAQKTSVITEQKAREMYIASAESLVQRDSYSVNKKTDPVEYAKRKINDIPVIYQALFITVIPNSNLGLDSCFFSMRNVPSKAAKAVRIAVEDSILKKNNLDLLAATIIDLAIKKNE